LIEKGGILLKKLMFLISFVVITSLIFYSNTASAEENNESASLTKESYNDLIDEELLPEDISYEEWLEVNDESLFEELDVPNVILDTDESTGIGLFATKTFTLKKGDILISNGTSSAGLTGHAGIAINSSQILHIAGPKKNPTVISVATWQKSYGIVKGQLDGRTHTKVYRVSNSSAAKAGEWAVTNYKGKKYSYGFTGSITAKNPTYCSKIVWQAYNAQGKAKKPATKIISPYQLPTHITGAKGLGIL
jgi:uncharacterized protein YycO